MASYSVKLISLEERNKRMFELASGGMHERKADIHGCCIKLFTDNHEFKDAWESNFKPMLDGIRPHGRIFAVCTASKKFQVLYDPSTKTVFIENCDYYGWVKSIALGLVADYLEDVPSESKRNSIHGSYVDLHGQGIAIIGTSGSGKTTLTYGLMTLPDYNFMTDDWLFVRTLRNDVLAFSAEKNSYIRDDLAQNWPQFEQKLKGLVLDNKQRAIVDVKHMFGSDRVRSNSTLTGVVLLTRDKKNPTPWKKLSAKEALEFMVKNDFCNPHQLLRSKKKVDDRKKFFLELFGRVPVYLLNTIETPKESMQHLQKLMEKK